MAQPTVLKPPASSSNGAEDSAEPTSPQVPLPPQTIEPPAPPTAPQAANPTVKSPPKETADIAAALERRGSLNLHGLTLNAALFAIGEQWNINIVAGNLEGNVNGVFNNAPLREILDSILLSNNYNYRVVGKSLVVSPVSELGQVNPFFQSATIKVHTADIDEVVEGAKLLSTPHGQVRALKSARSIVVLDFPDRVDMIRKFVAAIDGASGGFGGDSATLEVGHFRTQHITAKAAEQALQPVLSKEGKVGIMEKEDRLVVTDRPENLAMIEKLLARIDHPRPQVRITALIYDISLQDLESLGLRWNKVGFRSSDNSGVSFATSSSPFDTLELTDGNIDSLTAGAGNFAFGTLSEHIDINMVCHALQEARDARLLADPNVAVLDNEEAVFRSVREIPIQQLTETQQGGNIGTTAFREAGIKLTVTPKVAADCTIAMDVAPEFSRHVGNDENGQPIIDTRSAETTLRVTNRQMIVIGGLRQREDIGEFSGIPYLKDFKVVGRLFRSRTTTVRESELVVFLMPEIIDCADVPAPRQQAVADTIGCRLAQIPEAEGCPPGCRRLPVETVLPYPAPCPGPADDGDAEASPDQLMPDPLPEPDAMPRPVDSETPLSFHRLPPIEAAPGNLNPAHHLSTALAAEPPRRLPAVPPATPGQPPAAVRPESLFAAPTEPVKPVEAAEQPEDDSIWR
jgi:general secretion pathway protein D